MEGRVVSGVRLTDAAGYPVSHINERRLLAVYTAYGLKHTLIVDLENFNRPIWVVVIDLVVAFVFRQLKLTFTVLERDWFVLPAAIQIYAIDIALLNQVLDGLSHIFTASTHRRLGSVNERLHDDVIGIGDTALKRLRSLSQLTTQPSAGVVVLAFIFRLTLPRLTLERDVVLEVVEVDDVLNRLRPVVSLPVAFNSIVLNTLHRRGYAINERLLRISLIRTA